MKIIKNETTMKYCDHCNKDYPDTINFCTECGKSLVAKSDSASTDQKDKTPQAKKGKSIWKKCLIVVAIIVVGFLVLMNYLSNAATYLRVEPSVLVVNKGGGETVVDIDYDGYIWTINHVPDWVVVNEYDRSFGVEILKNTSGYNREGSITVQSGEFLAQLIIQQKGTATYISASKNSLHFAKKGGTEIVTLDTDGGDYTVEYPDYLSVTAEGDDVTITAPRNVEEYRRGVITITEDNVRTKINFTQGGTCNSCNGSGRTSCGQCMGQGGWGYGMFYSQCWLCHGSGSLQCGTCHGSGERD